MDLASRVSTPENYSFGHFYDGMPHSEHDKLVLEIALASDKCKETFRRLLRSSGHQHASLAELIVNSRNGVAEAINFDGNSYINRIIFWNCSEMPTVA